MNRKRKCPYCKDPNAGRQIVDYTGEWHHDNVPYQVTVPNVSMLKCPSCDWQTIPDESYDIIFAELYRQAGILMPADIKLGREKLGLSQKEFGKLFDVAEATVERWENGGQIHKRDVDNSMRALFNEGNN